MVTRQDLIDSGHIVARRHPTEALTIFNYTKKAQYEKVWNEHTIECRGLVQDDAGRVVARGYHKFFNVGQTDQKLPARFRVFDKLDGSLGITYPCSDGSIAIATRGSFDSAQARWATKHWRENYAHVQVPRDATFCLEIIYPENKVVLDYQGLEALVLHGIIDNATGADRPDLDHLWPGPRAKSYDFQSVEDMKACGRANAEGFVLVEDPVPAGRPALRLKVKLKEYEELHRLLSGLTPLRLWEALECGGGFEDVLTDEVPDEIFSEVVRRNDRFFDDRKALEDDAFGRLLNIRSEAAEASRSQVPLIWGRKEYAARINQEPEHLRKLIFLLMDGKAQSIQNLLWKMVEPRGDEKFSHTPDLEG